MEDAIPAVDGRGFVSVLSISSLLVAFNRGWRRARIAKHASSGPARGVQSLREV